MPNNYLGNNGEAYAALYLQKEGYILLHSNWRGGRGEIDLIALQQDVTVFVEVKTRKNTRYGFPEESVSTRKMENLLKTAEQYLLLFPSKKIRFDVISIILVKGEVKNLLHIRDAFG